MEIQISYFSLHIFHSKSINRVNHDAGFSKSYQGLSCVYQTRRKEVTFFKLSFLSSLLELNVFVFVDFICLFFLFLFFKFSFSVQTALSYSDTIGSYFSFLFKNCKPLTISVPFWRTQNCYSVQ